MKLAWQAGIWRHSTALGLWLLCCGLAPATTDAAGPVHSVSQPPYPPPPPNYRPRPLHNEPYLRTQTLPVTPVRALEIPEQPNTPQRYVEQPLLPSSDRPVMQVYGGRYQRPRTLSSPAGTDVPQPLIAVPPPAAAAPPPPPAIALPAPPPAAEPPVAPSADGALEVPEPPHPAEIAGPDAVLEPDPAPVLSEETKQILSTLPSALDRPEPASTQRLAVERYDPELEGILNAPVEPEAENEASSESEGVRISVQQTPFNADYELERAYHALLSGETEAAIDIYKRILGQDPGNQPALFGLATTYHRVGELKLARPFYGKLLQINPEHRDALNNFLALAAEEAPEDALRQMEMLEDKNPEYGPLLAQMAILYQKLGNPDAARRKMTRAANLSPENLAYTFNLAVLLDRQERYDEAVPLYQKLMQAAMRGEPMPADVETIRTRLAYLATRAQEAASGGGMIQ